MLRNNKNLNDIVKKILNFYKEERFPLHACIQNATSEHFYQVLNDVIADYNDDNNIEDVINEANQYLNTPLHIAALYNKPDIVQLLLERGANSQLQNALGDTPLHIAACMDRNGSIVKHLLTHTNTKLRNANRNTPLHIAIVCQNLSAIEHFFNYKKGIKVFTNIKNSNGETPLDLANQDVLNFINNKKTSLANHMIMHSIGKHRLFHLINNVGIDINNTLLANGNLMLTDLTNFFNSPNMQASTLNKKLMSIKHNINCGARIFKIDGNGKSMMSILAGMPDNHRRSLCNILEAHKKKIMLYIKEEESCIEEMPDGFAKEQMHRLLDKWQSKVELYQCIEEISANSSLPNSKIYNVNFQPSTSHMYNARSS